MPRYEVFGRRDSAFPVRGSGHVEMNVNGVTRLGSPVELVRDFQAEIIENVAQYNARSLLDE